jgi:hypothetical protein
LSFQAAARRAWGSDHRKGDLPPGQRFSPALPVLAAALFLAVSLRAGPPFFTDDPETIAFRHWEFYVASAQTGTALDYSGTAPHFEVNYGFVPGTMVHLIVGAGFDLPRHGRVRYGLGDMEIGVQHRFLDETKARPMVGTFPLIVVPTGSSRSGLGSGRLQAFFPLWVQKSWGPWTTYGGGGFWINPGPGNKDYWWFGWEVQRDLSRSVTLGGEVFAGTPSGEGEPGTTGFNIGAMISLGDGAQALLSAGRDLHGPDTFFCYVAYYLTFGPRR